MKTIQVVAAIIFHDGWDYPAFHLTMRCYLCSVVNGTLTLMEHIRNLLL